MSITVQFEIPISAEANSVDEILKETLSQTVAFSGNEGVRVLEDRSNPSHLIIDMTWASDQAYDDYLTWRQTPAGNNRLMSLLAGPPTTTRFATRLTLQPPMKPTQDPG